MRWFKAGEKVPLEAGAEARVIGFHISHTTLYVSVVGSETWYLALVMCRRAALRFRWTVSSIRVERGESSGYVLRDDGVEIECGGIACERGAAGALWLKNLGLALAERYPEIRSDLDRPAAGPLEPGDHQIIVNCLRSAASSTFFTPEQRNALFGGEVALLQAARSWPMNAMLADERALAAHVIGNLIGYPHGHADELALHTGADRAELERIQRTLWFYAPH